MNIKQIAVDSSEVPSTNGYILGLGEDNQIYSWNQSNGAWKLMKQQAPEEAA